MVREGQLMQNRRGAYGPLTEMNLIAGSVQAHRDGFGFLIPDAGGKDVFLSPRQMRSLMNGDRVLVCAHTASRRSTSGETCTVPKAVSRAGTPGGGVPPIGRASCRVRVCQDV